jgi:NRAMP (natural resistance-associated macrophage protein)-like metal ion transporter
VAVAGAEDLLVNTQPSTTGLEPLEEALGDNRPSVLRSPSPGIRLNIRGRSVKLRGLRRQPRGFLRWLIILGPGLIACSAGNDAGGIATYSATGAKYGYDLIWVMVLITVSLAVVQETASRVGAATGRGLLDLIRSRFGLFWGSVAVAVIFVANAGLVVSEFIGIGAAAELFGVSKFVAIPAAAVLIWYLIVFGRYERVEKIFLLMTLIFFAYPVAAVLANPDWGAVLKGTTVPSVRPDAAYVTLLVGLIGTTITPYMQLFQQSSVVERGAARQHYGPERVDAYVGSIFSNVMSISMIVATAATLHVAGKTEIGSAADAAAALEPVAGSAAKGLFAVGLLGASLLAAGVLPLATSYAISEMFGFPKGVNLDYRRGRVFFGLFSALVAMGAAVAMAPGLPIIELLVAIQVLNGALLPVILVFLLLLANDRRLMGDLANTRRGNVVAWTTCAVVTVAVVAMLVMQAIG